VVEIPHEKLLPIFIPRPQATWDEIGRFALTFNGYAALSDCGDVANGVADRYHRAGVLPSELPVLRGALFFEQRRYHHFGDAPEGDDLRYLWALIEAIRDLVSSASYNPRPALSMAISWRLVAEMMRWFHQSHKLRVFEKHPGGGQYDGLALHGETFGEVEQLCFFNWPGSLTVFGSSGREGEWSHQIPMKDLVSSYLCAPDPAVMVDWLAVELGLADTRPEAIPSTTPPVLVFRLIAEILERSALGRDPLEARWGFFDTSGEGGGPRRAVLARFPHVEAEFEKADGPDNPDQVAMRVWYLAPPGSGDPRVLFDLRGVCHFAQDKVPGLELMAKYRSGGSSLLAVVRQIEAAL
jgi:hypothetical protein